MAIEKGNSVPRKGMNRDTHPSELGKEEYTFAINTVISDENGNGPLILQNENSNIRCSGFKAGYKVLGHKYDQNRGRAYFFLKNVINGCSEIGYIDTSKVFEGKAAIEAECGCDFKVVLETPLEEESQVGYCTYNTLMTDCCPDFPNAPKCLNFDLQHPIHSSNVEIKDERSGYNMYFTDNHNPPRVIKLDEIDKYYLDKVSCEEPTPSCLQCEELRVFKLHNKPCIKVRAVSSGGNLRAGTYEATMAYCDISGEEITDYQARTNRVPIFDKNNRILSQPNLDYVTNFSIEYEIENIDNRYLYYKIVIIRRNGLDGVESQHTLGVYPTTTSLVIFASLDGAKGNETNISQRREQYKKAKGISAGNGYLYQYGMESQREINLQPVVSLMGGFAEWSTYQTMEDAYEDGAIVANYTGQMRDEVYPYSIKFYLDGGFETAVFPFIPRPPRPDELTEFVSEDGTVLAGGDNVESIVSNNSECNLGGRRYRWQFENTAQVGEKCLIRGIVGTVEYTLTEELECKVSDGEGEVVVVGQVDEGQVEVPGGLDLISYINNNSSTILEFSDTSWEDIQQVLEGEYPEKECVPEVGDNCEQPELKRSEVYVISIDEQSSVEQPQAIGEYGKIGAPGLCPVVKIDPEVEGGMRDTNFETTYMLAGEIVYERVANTNTTCLTSDTLLAPSASSTGYHLVNKGQVGGKTSLVTTVPSTPYTTIFEPFLHSNVIWFKVDFSGRQTVILQLSDLSPCEYPDNNNASHVRVSFYSDCSGTLVSTYSQVKSLPNMNLTMELSASDFSSGEAFIAIDSDMRQRDIGGQSVYTLRAPCSCFAITVDNQQTVSETSFTGMKFGKKQIYEVTCSYSEPELDGCKPVPYEGGEFAYWESVLKYPCNKELWKSDNLTIFPDQIPNKIRSKFGVYYTTGVGVGGAYNMSTAADFQDKPIRHYKFPCSLVSPFMNTQPQGPFKDSIIYPIGFRLDNEIIESFLDIALSNKLITLEERQSIKKYEIFRGNRTSQKSVVAKGVVFDYYKYKNSNNVSEDVYYPNYPLNTLGVDEMNGGIHPINSDGSNSLFAFHSPDTHFHKPTLPSEVKVEGYLFGKSLNYFDEVQGHPRYAVIGKKAELLAGSLATAEVGFEVFLEVSEWATTGFNNPLGFGTALAATYAVVTGVALGVQSAFKWGRYREEWMESFRKLGNPNQFAYYSASIGHYNLMSNNVLTGSRYRGLASTQYVREGKWKLKNKTGVNVKTLNNTQREDHVMIDMGNYKVSHPSDYITYDNYSTNPNTATRASGMHRSTGKSSGIVRNTAVPYVSLKRYLPAQYGTIDSISWINTGYCGSLDEDQPACDTVFGGDTYISRFSVKRKFPFFLTTALGQPDNTPFEYSRYFNIPIGIGSDGSQNSSELSRRYYLNYLIDSEVTGGLLGEVFPTNATSHRLDFPSLSNVFYERPPSKFYLYSYGVPYFLVESTYNCNYRYAGTSLSKDFYPHHNDVIELTQQENVPIQEKEDFYINDVYFNGRAIDIYRRLPFDYERERYDRTRFLDNTLIWSKIDSSEGSMSDPWLVYGALDTYEFNKSNGKLVDVTLVENEQLLARFRNGVSVFGSVDLLADKFTTEPSLGTGGMFKGRNMNYYQTELGYAGTQNVPMVSCKFGHFWVDARRGKVFLMESVGKTMPKEITQGVSKWFKENLPFNILSVTGMTEEYIDNAYNGAGIAMVWDERNDRVILTKKDYRPLSDEIEYNPDHGFIILQGQGELCPEGYTYDAINRVCFREELVEKQPVGDSISVVQAGTGSHGFSPPALYTTYNSDGTANVDPLSSTGYTYESLTNTWWVGGGIVNQRYVNLLAKWVSSATLGTWYGGTKIIDVPSTKTYYVALAADDEFRFSVDGVVILTSDAAAMDPQHNTPFGAPFIKIHIYPIELEAGCRTIKVEGVNYNGPGLFAASILDNTYSEIASSTSQADLNEIYSTQHMTELYADGFTLECPEGAIPQGEGICDLCLLREEVEPDIEVIELGDERYFKECSWTVSYSPLTQSWVSYHSYKPNYYIGYNDYFQSGVTGLVGSSLWSHIPFNSSYQVFYGTLYPFTVEYPVSTRGAMSNFNYIEYWLDIRKYYNKHDFSDVVGNGFNKAVVYKNDQNTGQLELRRQVNNDLSQSLRYPKYNANSTEVLQTEIGGKWSFNFLYNRIRNEKAGIPLWLYDCPNVEKTLNHKLINYQSTYQDRLRGDYFLVRLTQDVNSRFKYMFRYAVDERNYYNQ